MSKIPKHAFILTRDTEEQIKAVREIARDFLMNKNLTPRYTVGYYKSKESNGRRVWVLELYESDT